MKGKITAKEVDRALVEFVPEPEHEESLQKVITDNFTPEEIFEAHQSSLDERILEEIEHLIPGWEDFVT